MMSIIKNNLFWILLIFLGLGYFYPAIGVVAIVCMLAPVALAPFKGRFWCGNFCPRGSFYEVILKKFSPQKPIPAFLRSTAFRIFIVMFIMTVFTVQMYFAWGNLSEMGLVFIRLIFITTLVGIALGVVYHHRSWCSFCPMGTMASWLSKKSMPLAVNESCVNCKVCEKVCPFGLKPYTAAHGPNTFTHPDCLKCSKCIAACPKKALSY